jgi:putative protein-disulfide isomerase
MKTLIYVHDPMCSWCWGFEPTRRELFSKLAGDIGIRRLVGGLAPDSDQPMPETMQAYLQQTWRRIEQIIPETRFNYDFWTRNTPRRSTYPANRAVIAARLQGGECDPAMTAAIQRAYYLEARNPSDKDTLIDLAGEIGLDTARFADDLLAASTQQMLLAEIGETRTLGMDSFPSLAVLVEGSLRHIRLDYGNAEAMLREIENA